MKPVRVALAILVLLAAAPQRAISDSPASAWAIQEQAVDEALVRGDLHGALRAWRAGYGAALRSRTWVGLIEMGDAVLRIEAEGGLPDSARPAARRAYLEALVRAKAERSVRGALRAGAAFDDLGDGEVAERCVRIAEGLARRQADPALVEEVVRAREKLTARISSRRHPR